MRQLKVARLPVAPPAALLAQQALFAHRRIGHIRRHPFSFVCVGCGFEFDLQTESEPGLQKESERP